MTIKKKKALDLTDDTKRFLVNGINDEIRYRMMAVNTYINIIRKVSTNEKLDINELAHIAECFELNEDRKEYFHDVEKELASKIFD